MKVLAILYDDPKGGMPASMRGMIFQKLKNIQMV
jgi:hypothetical protein